MTGAVQSTFADRIDWIQYWIFIFNLSLNRIQTLPLSFEKANLCGQAVYTFFNSLALAVDTYGLWWVEKCVEFLQSSDAVFPFPPMWHENCQFMLYSSHLLFLKDALSLRFLHQLDTSKLLDDDVKKYRQKAYRSVLVLAGDLGGITI